MMGICSTNKIKGLGHLALSTSDMYSDEFLIFY